MMIAPFGVVLLLLLVALVLLQFVVPAVVLSKVAAARGQSTAYAYWALLGWLGLVIGLLMMMAMPQHRPSRAGR